MDDEKRKAASELRCPVCGSDNMVKQKCKIICQNCGFMSDCSDND